MARAYRTNLPTIVVQLMTAMFMIGAIDCSALDSSIESERPYALRASDSQFSVTIQGPQPFNEPFIGSLRIMRRGKYKVGDILLGAICLNGTYTITIRAQKFGEFTGKGKAFVGITRPGQQENTLDFAFTLPSDTTVPQWVLQHVSEAQKRYTDSIFLMMSPEEFAGDNILVFLGEIQCAGRNWNLSSP